MLVRVQHNFMQVGDYCSLKSLLHVGQVAVIQATYVFCDLCPQVSPSLGGHMFQVSSKVLHAGVLHLHALLLLVC